MFLSRRAPRISGSPTPHQSQPEATISGSRNAPADAFANRRRRLTVTLAVQLLVRLFGASTGLVVAAFLARSLSTDEFGQFAVSLALVAVAMTATDFGFTATGVRRASQQPESANRTAAALIVLRLVAGTVSALILTIVAILLIPSTGGRIAAFFVLLTLPVTALGALQPIAQAQLRIGALNVLLLTQSALWTATVVLLSANGASLPAYGAGMLVANTVQGLLAWFICKSDKLRPDYRQVRAELQVIGRAAWPLGAAGLFVIAYHRLDSVLVFALASSQSAAVYSAAYRMLDVLQVLPVTALSALLPLFSLSWDAKAPGAVHERRHELFCVANAMMVALALPITVGGIVVAPRLVTTVYGHSFDGAGYLLQLLLLSYVFICLSFVVTVTFIASGLVKTYATLAGGVAVANIGANILLIPAFGAEAAAFTTLATEATLTVILLALAHRNFALRLPWRSWAESGLSTVVMFAGIILVREYNLSVVISAGVLSYGLAVFCIGTSTKTYARSMVRTPG